ncbi:hypothetical protein HY417_02830 [Candidatus Kaiserbacteria bacterium]|nr:hypothetical protein [Candidatus Kaiserbacteria bacterium]
MLGKDATRTVREIAPEDIFIDSTNLPRRDDPRLEGRVVRRLSPRAILGVGVVLSVVLLGFGARLFDLSVLHGSAYAEISRENRFYRSLDFASRGELYDRTGRKLAWNIAPALSGIEGQATSSETTFARRVYSELPGLSHTIGYVRYPKADASGTWWREDIAGIAGAELSFNDMLAGTNGSQMVEIDATGKTQGQIIVEKPIAGKDVVLAIDAEVQSKLFSYLSAQANAQGFVGGAAAIMDIETGELIALTSFPIYDNAAFSEGDTAAVRAASNDSRSPLLDRAISGLYAPGSIVKPIFAAAALNEGIIDPEQEIVSTGAITIPNPYDPERPSVYRDWTVHGSINMREAIAVSSDEYFYTIGGGYGSQIGLGIRKLDEYARVFGLGELSGIALAGEEVGVIPTPEWKAEVFGADDPWRIGNTYHTAIGQYGFQVTPLQVVRFIAAIGNGGKLLTPQIVAGSAPRYVIVGIPDEYLRVVREGMRLAVTSSREDATVKILNIPGIEIAAKTGTAQIGAKNEWINSWSVGFWPAEDPKYAYAIVLERARAGTLSGAAPGARPFFEWLVANKPEYVR